MDSISLSAIADERIAAARQARSGRAAHTVHGGHTAALRQTLLALAAGHSLRDHDSPGEATLQVLTGTVRLTTATSSWEGHAGDHVAIPDERHGLTAVTDSAVLLTVVVRPG
jgi:quercetin dioxygenase-like cupin family protein